MKKWDDWFEAVDQNGPVYENKGNCWLWTGALVRGYGVYRNKYVHRLSYERFIGHIPLSMEADHLCRNKACCNPNHLEIVTPTENKRRAAPYSKNLIWLNKFKTHCKYGHPFNAQNTEILPSGSRKCLMCKSKAYEKVKANYARYI